MDPAKKIEKLELELAQPGLNDAMKIALHNEITTWACRLPTYVGPDTSVPLHWRLWARRDEIVLTVAGCTFLGGGATLWARAMGYTRLQQWWTGTVVGESYVVIKGTSGTQR